MTTTIKQDEDFAYALFIGALDKAIEWIRDNLTPAEVFDESALQSWAKEQATEDVTNEDDLHRWASDNDYVLSTDASERA